MVIRKGAISMRNCKKCGALIYGDFLFCGKCGEPVADIRKPSDVIKMKKPKRFGAVRSKVRKSFELNLAVSAVWLVITAVSVFLLFRAISYLRAASATINHIMYQLVLKYEYVREGLSLSYVAPELRTTVKYFLSAVYIAALAILISAGLFFIYCHVKRCVLIKKRAPGPVGLNKIQNIAITVFKILAVVFAAVIIAANLFIILI